MKEEIYCVKMLVSEMSEKSRVVNFVHFFG